MICKFDSKNIRRFGMLALTGAALVLFSPAAKALVFEFSYSGTGGDGTGEFFTGPAGSPYTLTGIAGTTSVSGGITGLSLYAGADNLLYYPTQPFVDFSGISFSTAGGVDYNLFSNGGYFQISSAIDPVGNASSGTPIEFSVTAAPELATWMMMLLGFAGVGFVAYRRTKRAVVAAA